MNRAACCPRLTIPPAMAWLAVSAVVETRSLTLSRSTPQSSASRVARAAVPRLSQSARSGRSCRWRPRDTASSPRPSRRRRARQRRHDEHEDEKQRQKSRWRTPRAQAPLDPLERRGEQDRQDGGPEHWLKKPAEQPRECHRDEHDEHQEGPGFEGPDLHGRSRVREDRTDWSYVIVLSRLPGRVGVGFFAMPHGTDDFSDSGPLALLALGWRGLEAWRRDRGRDWVDARTDRI